MNTIATFRLCTLSDDELLQKVGSLTDKLFQDQKVPPCYVPARPNEDYDLLVGELVLRFKALIDTKAPNPHTEFVAGYDGEKIAVVHK